MIMEEGKKGRYIRYRNSETDNNDNGEKEKSSIV
jgi:hypothetical protein